MAPRGRPRKAGDRVSSSPAGSRESPTTRQSLGNKSKLNNVVNGFELVNSRDDSLDPLSGVDGYPTNPNASGTRTSLSSVSTSDSHNGSTGYSTPTTSAFATPAPEKTPAQTTSTTRRRGRPRATENTSTPVISAVARAAAIRNSKYALNSATNKRKKINEILDSDDDEDLIGNDTDAQIARALQQEENEAMVSVSSTGRPSRKIQKIAPKTTIIESDTDTDFEDAPVRSQKLRIELGAKGSNGVSFGSGKKKIIIDSDDDDDFVVEDSDDEFMEDGSESESIVVSSRKTHYISPRNRKMLPPPSKNASKSGAKSSRSIFTATSFLKTTPALKTEDTAASSTSSPLSSIPSDDESSFESDGDLSDTDGAELDGTADATPQPAGVPRRSRGNARNTIHLLENRSTRRGKQERKRLELHHPELQTMWKDLENLPKIGQHKIEQPKNINRQLKPFQLEGVAWMKAMEETEWGGGLLGDEMGMGKTIQAVSLIMSDWPAKQPTLVLIPPVALMQWQQEIADYTDGTLKTFVYHGTNIKTKGLSLKDLMKYNVILMSYNSLESMYRKQEKGFKRKNGMHKEDSVIHQIHFHRVILDEAHNIKQRTTGSAKACFALKADHKWCLSGTPLQNRIGEFFSLVRFLDIRPFACYFCKQCPCSQLNWDMNSDNRCTGCNHSGMQHVSVFNQELLNPIQKYGNSGEGKVAFRKLRILTDRFMLRRVKRDHSSSMELPAKEIYVDRQFFGEEENDFAASIMNSGTRKFETYVAQGVLLNNYANVFGLIMQMRQVADHPDLILKKNSEGGQNILVCCICDETAEEAIRSACRHDFCRECAKNYLHASESPDCPTCHIPLAIDLEQPDMIQDEQAVKKSSIINRIKMENWTSSSKIEALVHDLHELRSKNMSSKSIIFSQFTTMLQLVEWRLRRAGITTVMLDGSMTPAQRQASINHFMTDVSVECFLVSLKAGGVALNLTEASKVFIVDPWWNPAAEWQSADRCHRIGQARPCSITRLCIEDSVESRMVLLQEKKANMINSTINADESAMESLTPEDMQFLFRGT